MQKNECTCAQMHIHTLVCMCVSVLRSTYIYHEHAIDQAHFRRLMRTIWSTPAAWERVDVVATLEAMID